MPYSATLLWPNQLGWKSFETSIGFVLCVHFDIWNEIEEKKFLDFFSFPFHIHRGDQGEKI